MFNKLEKVLNFGLIVDHDDDLLVMHSWQLDFMEHLAAVVEDISKHIFGYHIRY